MNQEFLKTLKNEKKKKKLILIQVLRAVAVILVVMYHLTDQSMHILKQKFIGNLFSFGGSGVDIFFVLSGFIIFYNHHKDIGERKKFKSFVTKRFLRIYPIYLLVTIFVLPIYLLGYGENYKRNLTVIIKSLFLLPQDNGIYPIVNVGWTLSYEVLFYAIFSLFILMKPQLIKIFLASWVLSIIVVSSASNIINLYNNTIINFLFDSRNLEFFFGAIVAFICIINQSKIFSNTKYILLLGILIFAIFGINDFWLKLVDLPPVIAYGIPAALIVLGAAYSDLKKPNNLLKTFVYLGDASYSIYLTHFVVLTALMSITTKLRILNIIGYPFTVGIITIITIGFGYGFFYYIEKPLLLFLKKNLL